MRHFSLFLKPGIFGGAVSAFSACHCFHAAQNERAPLKSYAFGFGSGTYAENGVAEKDVAVPTLIGAVLNPSAVSSSSTASSSASIVKGQVYTWGSARHGALGHGPDLAVNSLQPDPVTLPEPIISVALGEYFGLALGSSGQVYGWGKRAHGHTDERQARPTMTKNGPQPSQSGQGVGVPAPVKAIQERVVSIAAGREHAVAVTAAGGVYVWGVGSTHALGTGSKDSLPFPTQLQLPLEPGDELKHQITVVSAAAGRDHTLLLDDKGRVWACGLNDNGQCGDGQADRYCTRPTRVRDLLPPDEDPVVAIAAGENHSVALTKCGKVYAWGLGRDGQHGLGTRTDSSLPRQLPQTDWGGGKPVAIAAGGAHTLILTDAGHVWSTGRGRNGQLGRGGELESVAAYRVNPVMVSPAAFMTQEGQATPVQIAAGHEHSLVLAVRR